MGRLRPRGVPIAGGFAFAPFAGALVRASNLLDTPGAGGIAAALFFFSWC